MGFNTTIFVLNDNWHQIESNAQPWTKALYPASVDGGEAPFQTTVMKSEHAEVFRLYGTHRNTIIELSSYSRETIRLIEGEPFQRDVVKNFVTQAKSELKLLERKITEVETMTRKVE